MKTFTLFLIGVLISFSTILCAQEKAPLVTVYLKNGQKVEGHMQMSIHEGYVTLEHDSLSRTQLAFREIKKIYFGEVPEAEPEPHFVREPGFFHITELGLQIGSNDYEANGTLSIHTINGYAISPYLMTGLGVGFDHFGSVSTLPVYASLRGVLTDRKVSPFYFGNIGGSLAWNNDHNSGIDYQRTRGGIFLHGGLGYQINMDRSGLLLAAGYKIQKTDFAYDFPGWNGDTHIEEKRTIRRLTLTIGYTF